MSTKVGIIIPCYNEEKQISILLENLIENNGYENTDILVVDDGSVDNTIAMAEKFAVNILALKVNKGKGMAIYSGINFFKAHDHIDGIIIIDGDNQHDPIFIKDFIKKYDETQDSLIIGARNFKSKSMPFPRKMSNTITSYLVSRVAKQKIEDSQSGYRFLDKKAMIAFCPKNLGFQGESEMIVQIARSGLRISSIPIKTIYHDDANSHIHPIKDTFKFIKWYLGKK